MPMDMRPRDHGCRTMGDVLRTFVNCSPTPGELEPLRAQELTVKPDHSNGQLYLFLPNKHAELAKLYAGTRWQNGGWATSLGRLPHAIRLAPTKIRGQRSRGVGIELHRLDVDWPETTRQSLGAD
jgi:hypothetical protein